MKGIKLLLIACLAPLLFNAAAVGDVQKTSRPTNRRATTTATQSTRRATATTARPAQNSRATSTRSRATTTKTRTATGAKTISSRPTTTKTISRTAQTPTRTVTRPTQVTTSRSSTRARAATTNHARSAIATPTREEIMSHDYKKCREVFYGCMDEFCANKDTQLKRCACSTRVNEFQTNKENLAMVEEKLLDFGQRLLTVSMDKEDAAALNVATEGELAFNQADKTQSKKMLDEIAKKLNTSFDDSNFDQGLGALTWSLDTDAAFDSINPNAGAYATSKSGTELYSAALPICREMTLEFCSPEELSIAEGGYQMMIEQDCNTVKKSYQSQADQARAKVFENSALLDMSRLNVHQDRNSDDILTCKSKMLAMLTDSTVCGANMEKCLDTSGQYIDPTTGQAFLTPNLANLTQLIKRPQTGDETWASINSNARYIAFLNDKKKFLEPAMEKCQDIADYVWESFIEDALSQIKIAQDAKLESVRQSCTTLVAQCTNDAIESIEEFDARALSIFGVMADKTANQMCADIKNTCTALFRATDTTIPKPQETEWETGITEITASKSYETIISTCREVGRNCIIQACQSQSGNFGLCENIGQSINRHAIVNRTACWNEVLDCVASAGEDTIAQIMKQQNRTATGNDGHRYEQLYNLTKKGEIFYDNNTIANKTYGKVEENKMCYYEEQTTQNENDTTTSKKVCIPEQKVADICSSYCTTTTTLAQCQKCRLAEEIWGNCSEPPSSPTSTILGTANNADTLLVWFAINTKTATVAENCRSQKCASTQTDINGICVDNSKISSDGLQCDDEHKINIENPITNCCGDQRDNATNFNTIIGGNDDKPKFCCKNNSGKINSQSIYFPTNITKNISGKDIDICTPQENTSTNIITAYTTFYSNTADQLSGYAVLCMTMDGAQTNTITGNNSSIVCNGDIFIIDSAGHYLNPSDINAKSTISNKYTVTNYFSPDTNTKCEYKPNAGWKNTNEDVYCSIQNPQSWNIKFTESNK